MGRNGNQGKSIKCNCSTSVLSLKFVKEMIFGLVSGLGFSRAENGAKQMGLEPLSTAVRIASIHRIVE